MTQEAERVLIGKILAGEQHLYAELVNCYKTYATTLANKILLNKSEAEEAAQDAFVKAFQHLAKFNGTAKFSTWLYRIVFNTAISYKRKYRPHFQDVEDTPLEHPADTEGTLEQSDRSRFILQAMARLSDEDRTALNLFYLKEFSLEEIADITGINKNTIKVRIHRARQRVAEELTTILKQEAITL